jgi:hypothetical protein
MRASFIVNGYQFQGKLNDGAVLYTGEEALCAMVEDSNVGKAIHELDLNDFSDDVTMQEKFRRVILRVMGCDYGSGFGQRHDACD